ncbi:MAG: arylesterase [Rhodobacter sp.]|jgi:acyl-CoA thioesterase-1|nr:arylesterase [Rhodobacter sp.]
MLLSTGAVSAEPVQIVALGDSLTQGYGVFPGRGFVPQIETWLRAHGADVTVQNAGVSGDTTSGGLARVDWALGDGADAMIVNLGGNDVLRGLDPATVRANLDRILATGRARGLPLMLVGLRAPRNYGPDYKAEFDAIYPDLAASYDAIFFPNFFEPLAGSGPGVDQSLMQRDGIHPNAAGVTAIVEAMGPFVLQLIERVE